jgi:hypothetical protein
MRPTLRVVCVISVALNIVLVWMLFLGRCS